uniref:Uncharacterized protein n=1 Tax=Dichotomaria marginata TaxID=268567 RepID=A0A1G4NSE7_9FLOR|nr:Hypothetical protein ORF_10 [Dichotomaria marginata]SCW21577.1 Hypothetical protein ORF_10 [Dichotomaria marginata]
MLFVLSFIDSSEKLLPSLLQEISIQDRPRKKVLNKHDYIKITANKNIINTLSRDHIGRNLLNLAKRENKFHPKLSVVKENVLKMCDVQTFFFLDSEKNLSKNLNSNLYFQFDKTNY